MQTGSCPGYGVNGTWGMFDGSIGLEFLDVRKSSRLMVADANELIDKLNFLFELSGSSRENGGCGS